MSERKPIGFLSSLLGSPWVLGLSGALVSGACWWLGWAYFLVFAWVPWLFLLERGVERGVSLGRRWLLWFTSLLLWNLLSVWWISLATWGGMVGAVVAMSALMSMIPLVVHWAWRLRGEAVALTLWVVFWVAYEYFFHNSEISWPWLTLGNGWASAIHAVQWYEFTGVLGGSLWTLLLNVTLFELIMGLRFRGGGFSRRRFYATAALFVVLFVGPLSVSLYLFRDRENLVDEQTPRIQTLVVQPNFDPYTEKFSGMGALEQVEIMSSLASSGVTPTTELVVSPETSLPNSIWEGTGLADELQLRVLGEFLSGDSALYWLTGATTLRYYPGGEGATATSRPLNNEAGDRYDAQNVALLIGRGRVIDQYIKSKLVVGVEMLPYPEQLRWLRSLSIDLGGTVGGLATQPERAVFRVPLRVGDTAVVAPIICYESAFGEYVTDYVRLGAQALIVITNDGWWGDTPGYRQHFTFSQLRCIETRRGMARSANTGISAFITPTGRVVESLPWWEAGELHAGLPLLDRETFYVTHGDYLGRVSYPLLVLILLYLVVQRLTVVRERRRVV